MINIHIQQKHRFSSIDIYDSCMQQNPSIYTYTFNASAYVYISCMLQSLINTCLQLHAKQLYTLINRVIVYAWIKSYSSISTSHQLRPSLEMPCININNAYCHN